MKCPICSKETKEGANFCSVCGKKIPRCPSCNAVITQKMQFCMNDGTELPLELLSLLPELSHQPTDTQKLSPKKIIPPKAPEKHFCQKCGKECSNGQFLCTDCQAKNKKTLIIIIITLLLLILLVLGAFFVSMALGAKPFSSGSTSNSVNSSEVSNKNQNDDIESTNPQLSDAESNESVVGNENVDDMYDSAEEQTEIHTYEIVQSDMSWSDARKAAQEHGGHLATITSLEEMYEVAKVAEESGLRYLWLGAVLTSSEMEWSDNSWITGENWSYENWYPGEPSKEDADGTKEYYLCLWKAKYQEEDIGWTFNDQRNDIVKDFDEYKGKVGYIVEYGDGYNK